MIKSHRLYEPYWQKFWEDGKYFETDLNSDKPKFYILDMFPYPSGKGLHVGHIEGYSFSDILARYKKMQGYNVFIPMGFDAFGLPAEQYALETGKDPKEFTYHNISNFIKQIKASGKGVAWSKSFATCDENYYAITQWIFKQLYLNNLAELKDIEVQFCPKLGTVLANDEIEIIDGLMVSERGHYEVVKKPMKQWVLKITSYADELLAGLKEIDWSKAIKDIQTNWIGKKNGANITFKIKDQGASIEVFTTRPDTLYGVSFLALAPEHPFSLKITTKENLKNVKDYIDLANRKTAQARQISKEKTGVFTGSYAINPINNELVPIWICDYVLIDFAQGALMAVPAHDERDYDFAKKYNINFKPVIKSNELPFIGDGKHINSELINGLNNNDATLKIIDFLTKNNCGFKNNTYKLRDWVFSRQRYWGEPFPLYYDKDNNIILLDDDKLPLLLPKVKNIKPSGDGKSPLSNVKAWTNFKIGKNTYSYDTNTMPQLAASSWYYIAHLLKKEDGSYYPINSPEAKAILDKWLPVDVYIGGKEHAVGHLLYARFWHKFFNKQGYIKHNEPFKKLINPGMILAGSEKMSKSRGNVVNPDDIFKEFGADTLRLYEMFLGPITQDKPWDEKGLKAARKFLDRIILATDYVEDKDNPTLDLLLNNTIKAVSDEYENMTYNTLISKLMVFNNLVLQEKKIGKGQLLTFIKLLYPICPHLTEEINKEILKSSEPLITSSFPKYNDKLTIKSDFELIFQINGKMRGKAIVNHEVSEDDALKLAKANDNVKTYLDGKEIVKLIYIKNKILNIVIK